LTSEAFLRGWQAFKSQKKEIKNIQAFLYQIARNLTTDHYREKGQAQFVSVEYASIANPDTSLEEKAMLTSDFEQVKEALVKIKEEYQEVIVWRYIDDLSVPEIAKMLNKSEEAVRVTIHRAMKALKAKLERV
jgi:RNA polymerase sigma-70 factor (ECF subfamily)